ncbi:hypothetical protein F6X40_08605 [Paraburkholderia sp. UCT31]|uniref:anti-phage dCTP deaminase n=1 Tax=Paraburkholderia sp. UCT31 TaxID=2615209 RepID=UPI0016555505|nr:anti-phage dCTP deaminase [Paraburkholderia sp. UCT31]MBC8736872.1 hypothetical protein [Paraburkholderia sp. UCT31]
MAARKSAGSRAKGQKQHARRETAKSLAAPQPSESDTSLNPHPYPELVVGLVGPVGVDLDPVISVLISELKNLNYESILVRLSKQIENFFGTDHSKDREDRRIVSLMDEGTRLRTVSGRGDAVALLAIAEIKRLREEQYAGASEKHAYILRSLKHPHEVQTLRNVYGEGFFLISAYSPREVRVNALAERISKSAFQKKGDARAKAERIVERDELEEDTDLGQDVEDAFPLADLFVDSTNIATRDTQISRFLQLLFGNIFLTPSRDEHGMYYARSAALRSSDLSRQVGAAILRPEGDLIAVGCNDVPKCGGDLYWPGDKGDARDFQRGIDATAEERIQVIGELLGRLGQNKLLSNSIKKENLNEIVRDLISGEKNKILKGTRVMSLLEFGRSVHAEMAALMSAARLGISVRDATLFSTTFPCHMCARHIVASGIRRVVYIEPYPKSKAKQLHQDSINVDSAAPPSDHVNFEPFVGISPRKYQDIFNSREPRKDSTGKIVDWRAKYNRPRFMRFTNSYKEIELAIVGEEIPLLLKKLGISVK